MEMKSYEEFLSTLDARELAELSKNAASSSIQSLDGKVDINNIPAVIAQSSATFTIELLRRYHAWLSKQLG